MPASSAHSAVFAAAMSTLSSSLNSCATAATNDLYLPLARGEVSAEAFTSTTRTIPGQALLDADQASQIARAKRTATA